LLRSNISLPIVPEVGRPYLRQQGACGEDGIGADHDPLAVSLDAVRDLVVLQMIDDLRRVVLIEIVVQQRHARRADAAELQEGHDADHADDHAGQRQDGRHAKFAEAVEKALHAFCSGSGMVLPMSLSTACALRNRILQLPDNGC